MTTLAYLWLAWPLCLLPFLVGWIRADHKHWVAYYVILLWKFYGHGGSSMKPITENTLFYGDNLFILREHILSESIGLIYLDPPFNSSRNYNVLFKDEHGTDSEARKERREKSNDLSLHNTGSDFLPALTVASLYNPAISGTLVNE